ncbi:MAG TPA: alpha/beta hydrolase-fold protein [Cellvibrio sp.]|nr:alpha/beta hydrolase-fold protein [Cellvibrio sp.]
MYKKHWLVFLSLLGITTTALAQQTSKQFVLNNTEIIPLHSKFTGRDHELVVVYPSTYQTHPDKKYPVLYYLDAYWDTPLLVSTYGNLQYDNMVPEFIMVGLSYPVSADYGKERRIDYTFTAIDEKSGKANLFLDFITQEVAPLIETQYRGEKADRVIAGNSLGGLLTLTAAYQKPGFFAGYIALSPAVEWDKQALVKLDQRYAEKHKALSGRVFMSYGETEYAPFRDPIIQFQKQLAARKYQGLELLNYAMEGLDHTAIKGDGYVRGLIWVWKPKKPVGPSGLERDMKAVK